MNFFELFQILHATHFILGVYLSLLLWRFVPAGLGPLFQPATSSIEALIAIAVSLLSIAWYFVWYGSLHFALRGRFPVLSPRAFSILFGFVYAGFVMVNYVLNAQAIKDLIANNPFYLLAFVVLLSLAGCGAVLLPRLKVQFDAERERMAQERDRRLDELHPWNSSATQEITGEKSDHSMNSGDGSKAC